jgi:hypothetical protein
MSPDFIKSKFLNKHQIDNDGYLEKYVNFFFNYDCNFDEYTEKHHILPVSIFPEFKDEEWNIIELTYEDHKLCHLWLFKSINIRTYQRPLNWMLNTYKNREELSKASKRGWENMKKSDSYQTWIEKRSNHMKNLSSEEQKRRANIFWTNIKDEEYLDFCNKMKEYWTEDRKLEKAQQMNEYYSNPENIEKKRIETQKRWDSMTEEERRIFSEKMASINKDESKRKTAGKKIKEKWKDEKYLSKMRNRKHRSGKKIKIVNPDGEEVIFDNMIKVEKEYNFSLHLIRKYRDKDIYIEESDLKEHNKLLLNCKIESV